MVVIRLARSGGKKNPFYHITVADRRSPRDGRFIERVGFFNPVARGAEERLKVDVARVEYWIRQGAQPSDRVTRLVKEFERGGPRPAATAPADHDVTEELPVEETATEEVPAEDVADPDTPEEETPEGDSETSEKAA